MMSAQAKPQLAIATPSDREIVMTRIVRAPRALVFDAFTKPEMIKRWLLGPDGWSMPVCDVDLRVGGTFHYVWRNDSDGTEFGLHGAYREVTPHERIVHAENVDQPWYRCDVVVTTAFAQRDGSTTVTMTQLFDSREGRDAAMESGMEKGVAASFDRLEEILA
jgi:uncharacterized protein YndB with AHSA1/START domain